MSFLRLSWVDWLLFFCVILFLTGLALGGWGIWLLGGLLSLIFYGAGAFLVLGLVGIWLCLSLADSDRGTR